MKKYLVLISIICSLLISKDNHIRKDAILFCLKPHVSILEIDKSNIGIFVNNTQIQKLIKDLDIVDIHPWIKGTSETDNDGDIYLNRIYRVILNTNTKYELEYQKSKFDSIDDIMSTEYDFIRKPFFTPNDSQYNQQ